MAKAGNLVILLLLAFLAINGVRITFFPANTCNLVRERQIIPIAQSVMDFHREQETRNVPIKSK